MGDNLGYASLRPFLYFDLKKIEVERSKSIGRSRHVDRLRFGRSKDNVKTMIFFRNLEKFFNFYKIFHCFKFFHFSQNFPIFTKFSNFHKIFQFSQNFPIFTKVSNFHKIFQCSPIFTKFYVLFEVNIMLN